MIPENNAISVGHLADLHATAGPQAAWSNNGQSVSFLPINMALAAETPSSALGVGKADAIFSFLAATKYLALGALSVGLLFTSAWELSGLRPWSRSVTSRPLSASSVALPTIVTERTGGGGTVNGTSNVAQPATPLNTVPTALRPPVNLRVQ